MTTTLRNQERLASLRNRPTLYELVASNGPVSVLVAYCSLAALMTRPRPLDDQEQERGRFDR